MPHFPVKGSSSLLLGILVPGCGGWGGDPGHRLVAVLVAAGGTCGQCLSCQGTSPKQLLAAPAGPSWHPGLRGIYWEFLVHQGPCPKGEAVGGRSSEVAGSPLQPLRMGCVHQHTPPGLCCLLLPLFSAEREKRVILLLCRLSWGSRN